MAAAWAWSVPRSGWRASAACSTSRAHPTVGPWCSWKRLAPDGRGVPVSKAGAEGPENCSRGDRSTMDPAGERRKRPGVIAAVQIRFGGKGQRAAGVAKVCPVCLQGMGDDLFPGRPGLAIDVKARIELDSGAFRDGCRITRPAVGMGGRTGNVAGPGVGTGEEEGVIDVPLCDLLRPDDAAQ